MEGRTAIVIASSLRMIRNCDHLYVLNYGEVVEQGSFEELSDEKDSYFNRLKQGMEM